jgi:molybdenum cofactor guanylyltransferase
MTDKPRITGVLLAGGQARRMGGGDKCLLPMAGQSLLQRAIARATPQVDHLILNANGNALRFARTRLTVVADRFGDFPGPLAGIHASLHWLRQNRPEHEWLASFACDTPFFPLDLVDRLLEAAQRAQRPLAVATSGQHIHGVFTLWHKSLLETLERTLAAGVTPRLQDWLINHQAAQVAFSDLPYDPFFNINDPQDLYAAEVLLPIAEQPA